MIAAVFVVLVLALLWRHRRRARQDVHAGIVATKPQFVTEPPHRRLASRKLDRL